MSDLLKNVKGVEEPFVHPGCLFKQSDLERMKYMVESKINPWYTSFTQLKAESHASYAYVVQGDPSITEVDRDGTNSRQFESDTTAAYLNALMWAITDNARHADKAVEIFNAWSNLKVFYGHGTAPLNAGLYAWKLIEAAEIIKSTYDGWAEHDIQKFKDMLVYPGYSCTGVPESVNTNHGTFYWRIYNGDPNRHGNQDLIAWRAMISMGVFLDNRIMYDRALRYFKGLPHRADDIPYASGPSLSGEKLTDNEYFVAYKQDKRETHADWGYNGVLEHYVWENGQNQESSRDQQHAFFGLGIAAGIAEVAWNQGDDVWNALDHRLLKGFEFMARYNTSYIASFPDQPEPWEPKQIINRKDRTGRWVSKQINPYFESNFTDLSIGDFPGKRPVFEQAVAHFNIRMGLGDRAIWTKRARDVAIEQSGYEVTGWSLDHPGWGGLTFRRPDLLAGDPVSGFTHGLPEFKMNVLPCLIQAVNFDYFPADGEGRTYYYKSVNHAKSSYRKEQINIQPSDTDRYVITHLSEGDWFTYTINVPATGLYTIKIRYAAIYGDNAINITFNGVDTTGLINLTNNDLQSPWGTYTVANHIELMAGVQAMQVHIVKSNQNLSLDYIEIIES